MIQLLASLFGYAQANAIASAQLDGDAVAIMAAFDPVLVTVRANQPLVNAFVVFVDDDAATFRSWLGSKGATDVICGRLPRTCMCAIPIELLSELSHEPRLAHIRGMGSEKPALSVAVPLVGADRLHTGTPPIRGAGQVVAHYETSGSGTGAGAGGGPDVFHPSFINPDGTTRIRSFLCASSRPDPGCPNPTLRCAPRDPAPSSPFADMMEIDATYINRMLAHGSKVAAAAAGLSIPDLCVYGGHGTPSADIAVGNGRGTGAPGMAPEAQLIVAVNGGPMLGLEYFFGPARSAGPDPLVRPALAADRPIVALTETQTLMPGGHAGVSLYEQWADAVVFGGPNRLFVRPAGNPPQIGTRL